MNSGDHTRGASIAALDARHRIEEICEPYALYPDIRADGTVVIPNRQLGTRLSAAVAAELCRRGVDASTADGDLRFGGATPDGAAALATQLESALYAIRPLHPARFLSRRFPGAQVPVGDGAGLSLPRSEAAMARLIGDAFVPADKKPPVLDLFRSTGPYLASIDDDPLVLLDAAAQIATHAGGLNPPPLLEALWTGAFGDRPILNPDTRRQIAPETARLAARLRRAAGPELPHVAFCGSGAEANELALRVAARQRPGRTQLVAFRGAFHGRTMAVLHATWNPAKRERFEIAGFEARWCPWPAHDPTLPPPPTDDLGGWDLASGSAARIAPAAADSSSLREHESLVAVEAALEDDSVVALLAEPMQSEGGEAHVSARFFVRLRALAAAYGVPFICDEVQTGFGLGGPFFWHRRFPLTQAPDLVTIAKKAQVGGVLSRWPIPTLGEVHVASAIRGQLQADIIDGGDVDSLVATVASRLEALASAHPDTVLTPRYEGWSFGFDLPDAESRNHLVAQRLWRGWMLYGAGARAVRFRLHPFIDAAILDGLFARIDASLTSLEAGEAPTWRQLTPPDAARPWPPRAASVEAGYQLVPLDVAGWRAVRSEVRQLQLQHYEAARRDDLRRFTALIDDPEAVCFLARDADGNLVGTAFGFPLEHFPALDGPNDDPELGRGSTLYSADVTVHREHRGKGLGVALKDAQLAAAMLRRRPNGQPRFHFVTGRNKVGATPQMGAINARFGAYEVQRYSHQYGDGAGVAIYYRIPLCAPRLVRPSSDPPPPVQLDLDGAAERRVRAHTAAGRELVAPWRAGVLNGAIVNKLSLCNFVTPGVVRAFEMLRASAPRGLGHLVVASSRAEVCDKGLRALKYHRGAARRVISVGPVSAGVTTAAARSLSMPADASENFFSWPSTADPTQDAAAALADLRREIASHGPDDVLAVVIEAVYADTGRAVPASLWEPLRALTSEHGIPLVLLETATGGWRNGQAMWRADTLPVSVDAVWYFAGGQVGFVFLSDALHVAEKLTLISTWDGDELSLARFSWEMRAARALPLESIASRLADALAPLGDVDGEGLFLSVGVHDPGPLTSALERHGVRAGITDEGRLRIVPPLDITDEELEQLERAIASLGA